MIASLGGENLWEEGLVLAPVFTLAGAVCASGSLALAKRAERGEVGNSSADPAAAELTNDEKRELPGDGGMTNTRGPSLPASGEVAEPAVGDGWSDA